MQLKYTKFFNLTNEGIIIMKMFIAGYIDPGTGAMLFSVLMGVVSALFFLLQKVMMKVKFILSGGKIQKGNSKSIPYVIFSDSKRYWNIFKPICDEFEKRKIRCEYWTASPDDPALDEKYEYVNCEFIGSGNKAFAKLNMMSADICLATTPGLDVLQWKRSANVKYYVHIVHEIGEAIMYRMFGLDYYDAVLLSGDFQIKDLQTLEEMRNTKKKEYKVIGSTHMDSMEKKKATLPTSNTADHKRTVLLAPTWGASSILNRFGEKILQSLVDTGYKIIVRPHPQSSTSDPELLAKLKKMFPENENFQWNSDNDNFKVLSESDILISDFSGVVFDYSIIFDRPIIYTDAPIDLSPYDACWIDAPIWRKTVLPKLGLELKEEDFSNIKSVIDDAIASEQFRQGREYVKNTAWMHRGEAAVGAVDYLINKHAELIPDEDAKDNKKEAK